MNGWDVLNSIISGFPPVAFALLLVIAIVAAIITMVGFSRNGLDFFKHGFRQNLVSDLLEKLAAKLATKDDIDRLENRLETKINKVEVELSMIKSNHFGHLKNFLTELTSILFGVADTV